MTFLLTFIRFLAIALWLLVLARVILSWVDPTGPQSRRHLRRRVHRADPGARSGGVSAIEAGTMDWSGFIVLFLSRAARSIRVNLVRPGGRSLPAGRACGYDQRRIRRPVRCRDPRGDWLSRLERTVHIREVTGSNPVSPTISRTDDEARIE